MPSRYDSGSPANIEASVNDDSFPPSSESIFGDIGGAELRTLKIDLSSRCNIACDYCFVDEGKLLPGPKGMAIDSIEKAIDWFSDLNIDHHCTVVLFGGEPLLNRKGFDAAHRRIDSLRKQGRNIRLQIITNAILASPEICDALANVGANVMVSIDGNKSQHDLHRIDHRGQGTYDKTIAGLRNLQKALPEQDLWVRSTMDGYTHQANYVEELTSLGVRQISLGYIDDAPPETMTRAEYSQEIDDLLQRMVDFARQGIHLRVHPFSTYLSMIYGVRGRGATWPRTDCGAATRIITMTPDGTFYPCEHAARVRDKKDWALGDVFTGLQPNLVRSFLEQTGRTNKGCNSCSRSNFCDQGCKVESTIHGTRGNCHGRDQMLDVLWSRLEYWYSKLYEEEPSILLKFVDHSRHALNRMMH